MSERAKILIVDDEPFNVDYLEQELEDFGYDTISATNGQEALAKVAAENPDLILLDMMMPLMDGFTVCRILKEHDDTRLIPIVMMTALGGIEDRIKGIEAGADDFLTKPVDERELRARLQTTLRLKATVDRKLGELRRIKDHFAKFVPEAVKRLVAANPEAPELAKRECDVSVLFLDISGYTRLSEHLAPESLNALVERYFSTFLDRHPRRLAVISMRPPAMASWPSFKMRSMRARAADTALALLAATRRSTLTMPCNRSPCIWASTPGSPWSVRPVLRACAGRGGRSRPAVPSPTWCPVWQIWPEPVKSSSDQRRLGAWVNATGCSDSAGNSSRISIHLSRSIASTAISLPLTPVLSQQHVPQMSSECHTDCKPLRSARTGWLGIAKALCNEEMYGRKSACHASGHHVL